MGKDTLTYYGWQRIERTRIEITDAEGKKRREKPLDEILGLKNIGFGNKEGGGKHKATAGAIERIAEYGQKHTYKEVEDLLKKEFGIELTDSTIQEITNYTGWLMKEEDDRDALKYEKALEGKEGVKEVAALVKGKGSKEETEYLMADGSMVDIREEKEGKKSSWKEVKLALMFSEKDVKKAKDGETVKIKKKEYAVTLGDVEKFRQEVFEKAIKYKLYSYKRLVIISDGATWIRKMGEDLFPDAIQILDFYHMAENMYGFARYIFKDDEKQYKPWAKERIEALRTGNAKDRKAVLEDLSQYKDLQCPAGVLNIYRYLKNNEDKIKYAEYLEAGLYISSGPMESNNKTVVQERMKRSGMRWNEVNAQRLLSLRVRADSDRWYEVHDKLHRIAA